MTRRILLSTTILLFIFLGLSFVAIAQFELINKDAGYYIPLSRLVALGLTPMQDFPTSYSPGAYYIFALFGRAWLSEPTLTRTIIGAFQFVNIALFLFVLRAFGYSSLWCFFFAALFGTWILGSDGTTVDLEPLQNFFLLLATFVLLKDLGLYSGLGAGVLAGAALMVKQYSLLAIPGLILIALRPWEFRNQYPALLNHRSDWSNVCLLLVGLPIPFLVFVVATQQNLLKVFLLLATFSGEAVEYYQSNPNHFLSMGLARPTVVLFFVLLTAWLLMVDRSWRSIALAILFLCNTLPLGIRPYPHYVQLMVPWGILLAAAFCSRLGQRESAPKQLKDVCAILISMPFFILSLLNLNQARLAWNLRPVYGQIKTAKALEARLQIRKDVLIFDTAWLFYFMDIQPPHLDYSFVTPWERNAFRPGDTKAIIVRLTKYFPEAETDHWLTQAGFQIDQRLSLDTGEFLVALPR